MKKLVIAIVSIIVLVIFIKWTSHRDTMIQESAIKYVDCVVENYSMTPSAYYAEHGEMPECNTTLAYKS